MKKYITGFGAICGLVALGGSIEAFSNGQSEYMILIIINVIFAPINIYGFIQSIKHSL